MSEHRLKIGVFEGQFGPKFQIEGVVPTQPTILLVRELRGTFFHVV